MQQKKEREKYVPKCFLCFDSGEVLAYNKRHTVYTFRCKCNTSQRYKNNLWPEWNNSFLKNFTVVRSQADVPLCEDIKRKLGVKEIPNPLL